MSAPMLTREGKADLFAQPRIVELVEVPEWGVTVRVQALSTADKIAYETALVRWTAEKPEADPVNAIYRLIELSIVDDDGQPVFTEADRPRLEQLAGAGFQRVLVVAQRLSLVDAEVIVALKKRSGSIRPNDSSTSLPIG